jgi:hypothetical protein
MKTISCRFSRRTVIAAAAGAMLAAAVITASGCLAVAAGAGAGATVAYVRGDLDATLNAGFEKSVRAANSAVSDLHFAKISEKRDDLQDTIIARNAADKKIELHLERLADDATKLKIRVGTFGDNAIQVEVLTKIQGEL